MEINNLKTKLEINMHIVEILHKKSSILYKIIVIILMGFIATNIGNYNYLISKNNKNEETVNNKFDKDIEIIQKAIYLDKEKKYLTENINKMGTLLETKINLISKISTIESNIENNKDFFQYIYFFILFIVIVYLARVLDKISDIEKDIRSIEKKLLKFRIIKSR